MRSWITQENNTYFEHFDVNAHWVAGLNKYHNATEDTSEAIVEDELQDNPAPPLGYQENSINAYDTLRLCASVSLGKVLGLWQSRYVTTSTYAQIQPAVTTTRSLFCQHLRLSSA